LPVVCGNRHRTNGGFLNVGNSASSTGTLLVDGGGTVAISHGGTFFSSGNTFLRQRHQRRNSFASAGTLTVQNGGLIHGRGRY